MKRRRRPLHRRVLRAAGRATRRAVRRKLRQWAQASREGVAAVLGPYEVARASHEYGTTRRPGQPLPEPTAAPVPDPWARFWAVGDGWVVPFGFPPDMEPDTEDIIHSATSALGGERPVRIEPYNAPASALLPDVLYLDGRSS